MNARILGAIARKEFLENVLSWRFLIALVLSTLILVTSVLALGASYEEDKTSYQTRVSSLERQQTAAATSEMELLRVLGEPNVLGIFVDGPGNALRREEPTGTGIAGLGGPGGVLVASGSTASTATEDVGSGSASPTNQRFSPLDLGFVVVVVMTFTAMLFSYDSISGERERGTLKLMLANPVPKDIVLFGKYLGGMASILLPFAVSLLVALAVLQAQGIRLAAEEWARLGLIVALAVPLMSIFYLLGLLVSSLVKRSATSLVAVALVWLILVFGAGNVAAVAAKETMGVSQDELDQAFAQIDDRFSARLEALNAEFQALQQRQREGGAGGNGTGGGFTQADFQRLQSLNAERNGLNAEIQEARAAVLDDARAKLDAQLDRAEGIARASPVEAFKSLATALARSDYWSYKQVAEAAEEYRREVDRARDEWLQDNPTTGGGGFQGALGGGRFQAPANVLSGFQPPTFTYAEATPSEAIASPSAVQNLLVLLAYNLLAFAGAYFALIRYDVR